jgi:capsular exopolysaccharide synthesis family protein
MVELPRLQGSQQGDLGHTIGHYISLFWRWKWYIVVSGPIALVVAGIIVFKVTVKEPVLSARALIGLENIQDMTAVRDVSDLVQEQSDLIQSRTFLEDIVKRLSLRLIVKKYFRSSIFDSVSVDSATPAGTYLYKIDKTDNRQFGLFFRTNRPTGIPVIRKFTNRPRCILKGNIANVPRISLGGIRGVLSSSFLNAPHDFTFKIVDIRGAVEDVLKGVTVKEADPSRRQFNIAISVEGTDYPLIADIANAIAGAFVERNANFRKGRTQNVLASLEKQFETVKRDFSVSQEALRNYRTANPTIGLSEDVSQRVNTLTQMENGMYNVRKTLDDAQDLMARVTAATPDDKLRVSSEALVFLAGKGNSSGQVLQNELNQLLAEQRELQRNYAADHPMRIENQRKIDDLEKDIQVALKGFITGSESGLTNRTSDIKSQSGQLQGLPSKQLQLAELQRRQQITSDIYSTVLSRYNQAKVANSAEVAEAYIMDPAVPPMPLPADPIKLLLIVLLVALGVALGPVLLVDYFDATVRTEYDFKKKTGKTFFEMVPKISPVNKRVIKSAGADQPLREGALTLVMDSFPNSYAHEVFRLLRTKVLLATEQTGQRVVCITSMESGTGKSFIAANLAATIATQNIRTILVDADLRRGILYKTFNCAKLPGLSEALALSGMIGAATAGPLIQKTAIPYLSFISAGNGSPASSEFLASTRFAALREALAKQFAVVIIDSAPIGVVSDAAVIAPLVSQYIVVVKAAKTSVHDVIKKISGFPSIEKRLMGYVLNFSEEKKTSNYYKRSKYGE